MQPKWVEAQAVANVHLAMKQNLTIIPVINKIDLPHADVALGQDPTGATSWPFLRSQPSSPAPGRHWHRG